MYSTVKFFNSFWVRHWQANSFNDILLPYFRCFSGLALMENYLLLHILTVALSQFFHWYIQDALLKNVIGSKCDEEHRLRCGIIVIHLWDAIMKKRSVSSTGDLKIYKVTFSVLVTFVRVWLNFSSLYLNLDMSLPARTIMTKEY